MSHNLRIASFVHTLRSDWNNGNAHFLRGLVRSLGRLGHYVSVFEREVDWSIENLMTEGERGRESLEGFARVYPDIDLKFYEPDREFLTRALRGFDVVMVHEWSSPELVASILDLREELGFRVLFHDTHHRASSSPESMRRLQVDRFDGVLVFGDALGEIYRRDFGLRQVWTLHEAADTSVFYPRNAEKVDDVVWIGNWGDDERAQEICDYLLRPAARMPERRFAIYGVRYPERAMRELAESGVRYGGYLPNLAAPEVYAGARLTVHIPRQQYAGAMKGIPTIRVFEALASGIPLISAPWQDSEGLFGAGDYLSVSSEDEMVEAMRFLLEHPEEAQAQADRGRERILTRHTCDHRAQQLTAICDEVLAQ